MNRGESAWAQRQIGYTAEIPSVLTLIVWTVLTWILDMAILEKI